MIHNHWLSIAHHDSQPLAQHNSPWRTTFGTAWQTMIHNHWHIITHNDSQPLAQHSTPWFTTTGSEQYTMIHNHWLNHGVLLWGSDCESWCAMLSQWLCIMVCYVEPVVVNHCVLCWASGCEWWCVMLSQWLLIMVCNTEPVVVNHGLLCCAKGCELWRVIPSQWLPMIHHHWHSLTHHDSQPLAQNSTIWFTPTGSE
jgi:hypothetical protein